MKNIYRISLVSICFTLIFTGSFAREFQKTGLKSTNSIKETAAGCEPGSAYKYLDINNVRTLCYSYGNGWFLENGEYEIPKGSRKTSMFSFSLWIGGIDINNNLKLAAYKYGQGPNIAAAHTKNDFWPGPLTIDGTAAIEPETCAKYDKLFPMTRKDVEEFLAWYDNKAEYPDYVIPKNILDWPAHGDKARGQAYYLAPFYDNNGDFTYNPNDGDYPYYDLANELCPRNLKPGQRIARAKVADGGPSDTTGILVDQVLKGDQTLWSVYNDKGNYHSETQGEPIGMEIRAQYFAFATNDEINNMTFYSYELVNRSTYTLTGTYFSQWVDPDLGYARDDYVGCDVKRGLGYCYNGKPVDGTGQIEAYGVSPPAVGVDFFQGPYMDPDSRDNPKFTGDCSIINSEYLLDQMAINGVNFGDGIMDNERYGMRRFVYHNNSGSGVPLYMQDPDYAPQYYNFLKGIWRDNTRMLYGGNAHVGAGADGPECDFMFPGDSDPCDWGTGGQPPNGQKYWTEETAKNNPDDRRFMQSAGPFTLKPGACNYITVGIPWAKTQSGTPFESVKLLRIVDDKCQSLFDNCFAVLNGPDAPDLTIEEMDKQVIIYITNRKFNDAGNNYQEKYTEFDPNIPNPDTLAHSNRNDSLYVFEGYQVYQLKDATVSAADITDPTKSALVFQCDIQNNVSKLVNWTFNQTLGGNQGEVMVDGVNTGVEHSFIIKEDMFATGDKRLINNKQYYYLAVAYAFNEWKKFNPNVITGTDAIDGQKTPYLQGRNNIKSYTAIPHIPVGDVPHSSYGEGPVITRIQGQGNGGMIIEMDDASIAELLTKPPADTLNNVFGSPDYPIVYHPTYKVSQGPLNVKVIDPLNVVNGQFTVIFDSMVPGPVNNPFNNSLIKFGKWKLIDETTQVEYTADTTTIYPYEQLFIDLGLALTINQVPYPGDSINGNVTTENGLLQAPPAVYQDSSRVWLGAVYDNDFPASPANWIRSGTYKSGTTAAFNDWDMDGTPGSPWDPNKNWQKIEGGRWAPYCLTASKDQTGTGMIPVGPAYDKISKKMNTMDHLASVDIVMTPNKAHWTRCLVIEMCNNQQLSEGNVKQFGIRAGRSVNVDGDTGIISADPLYNSDYISKYGMSWFPGYAINLETGARLNIIFGENSWRVGDNGRDMIFNPSPNAYNFSGDPVFGGQHYIYVMCNTQMKGPGTTEYLDFPAYDADVFLKKLIGDSPDVYKRYSYASTMYVSIPLAVEGEPWLSNEVKMKIRVAKPYERYMSTPVTTGFPDPVYGNNFYPVYQFNTDVIATSKNNYEQEVTDLDLINVVPNPYYAYNDYERNQLDNRIKITNLPDKCTVTIFNLSGTMIRQFNIDKSGITLPRSSTAGRNTDAKTSIDWDLKNFAGIPISGGVYLIYIDAPGLGKRTLKWFGILRPVDLNSL